MSKSLTLGIVFSSMGAGAVATTIGTVVGHLGSIEKKVVEAKSRMKELGLETVDAFAVQKKELQQAKEQLQAHQTATTSLGRSVAMARIEQEAATESLQAYRTELAGQTGRATDEQRVKLKTLRSTEITASDPAGDGTRYAPDTSALPRDFVQQPPLIPHDVSKYEISTNFNKCMDCHSAARYVEMNTTRVPPSHFKTRTGQELSNLSPSRYFCTQCHVPQVDARPLVNNAYQSSTRK